MWGTLMFVSLVGCLYQATVVTSVPIPRFASTLPTMCTIGLNPDALQDAICESANGLALCAQQCETIFGQDAKGQECVISSTGRRGCRCQFECAIGGVWGDPHLWTFDGLKVEYNGMCSYSLTKSVQERYGIPYFELRAKDRPVNGHKVVTVPDQLELLIPKWNLSVLINERFQVNGVPRSVPFRQSFFDRDVEQSIEISDRKFTSAYDGVIQSHRIETSFGLVVLFERSVETYAQEASGIFITVPKAWPFKSNLNGILGNLDGDRFNDEIDGFGIKRRTNDPVQSWLFGDSFCVNRSEVLPAFMEKEYVIIHEERKTQCENNPDKSTAMTSLCSRLNQRQFEACLGRSGLRDLIRECKIDICYADSRRAEKAAVCAAFRMANLRCRTQIACD